VRRWSEPVDLPLLLSQTKYISLLAADGQDVDSDRHDMVVQCSVGSQPKIGPLQYTYEVVVSFVGEVMV
jgi:hypothetical protein